MRNAGKRGLLIGMAICVAGLTVTTPARALLPAAIVGYVIAGASSAAGETYALGALAGLIGATGLYLMVEDSDGDKVTVPLGAAERNIAPLPDAPASAAFVSGRVYTVTNGSSYGGEGTTAEEACTALAADVTAKNSQYGGSASAVVEGSYCMLTYCNGGCGAPGANLISSYDNGSSSCPSGYSASGTSCVLSNSREVTDDRRCDLLLSGGQFSTASDLNCSGVVGGDSLQPMIRDGKAIAYGTGANGQPLVFTVSPDVTIGNRDWVQLQIQEQVSTSTQTQVKTTTVTIDQSMGTITSVETQTSPGSISTPTADTAPTTTTTPTTDNTPTVTTHPDQETQTDGGSNCGAPGEPACSIDDTGFANAPKPWEQTDIDPDLNAEKTAITGLSDPEVPWDWLPTFYPGEPVACHPLEFRGFINVGPAAGLDSTTQLDICGVFEYVRMFMAFLFGCGSLMYAWRSVTGANGPTVK